MRGECNCFKGKMELVGVNWERFEINQPLFVDGDSQVTKNSSVDRLMIFVKHVQGDVLERGKSSEER